MFDDTLLDDIDAVERLDRRGVLRALATSGAQVRVSARSADEAGLARLADMQPRGVVVAATGGSGAVGGLFDTVTRRHSAVPVQTCRSTPLPAWVGAYDLVVAVSQSGRAAGTLALAAEAARRGANLLTVGVADSPLADVCARAHGTHVPIDGAGSSSRAALWAQATPVLMAADALGLAAIGRETIESLADVLDEQARRLGPRVESWDNPAKALAAEVSESVPILLGCGPLGESAARRASAMFGRTGRVPVAYGVLPDAASQIVACFDGPLASSEGDDRVGRGIFADPFLDGVTSRPLRLIVLRDASTDGGGYSAVTDAVVAAAEDAGVRVSVIDATAPDPLLRLAHHVAVTDFAATYLALGLGYDPGDSRHVRLLRDARPTDPAP
ncbi:SIS domain-containing protein [Intrasporangium sp.]|uniref:SIS domain-containing protein n=1 Tax=Intrasporangium sp. TaxID=1925024 RepID=UPI003221CF95